MCAGALVLARVERLVFGAWDEKAGAVGSLWDVVRDRRLNHRPEVVAGVRADEAAALLDGFFAGAAARGQSAISSALRHSFFSSRLRRAQLGGAEGGGQLVLEVAAQRHRLAPHRGALLGDLDLDPAPVARRRASA